MQDLLKAAREALEEALAEAQAQELTPVCIELDYALENVETALLVCPNKEAAWSRC